MTAANKYRLPKGTSADGPYDLLVTPDFAYRPHGAEALISMAGPGQDRAWLICDDPAHGWVRATWETQDVDDRLPFAAEENE